MTANLLQPVMAGDAVLPSSMCSHTQAWIRKELFTVAAGASVCMFEHTILRVTRSEASQCRQTSRRTAETSRRTAACSSEYRPIF